MQERGLGSGEDRGSRPARTADPHVATLLGMTTGERVVKWRGSWLTPGKDSRSPRRCAPRDAGERVGKWRGSWLTPGKDSRSPRRCAPRDDNRRARGEVERIVALA